MSDQGAFAAFKAKLGLVDKACERVQYLFAHDALFKAWCAGRVARSRTFGPIDGLALPHIAISAVSVRSEFRPSKEIHQVVPIAITFAWEEYVSAHEPGEASVATAVDRAHWLLHKHPYLDMDECGGDRITERLDNFEPVSMAIRAEEGSTRAVFALSAEALYWMSRDSDSWDRYASS